MLGAGTDYDLTNCGGDERRVDQWMPGEKIGYDVSTVVETKGEQASSCCLELGPAMKCNQLQKR